MASNQNSADSSAGSPSEQRRKEFVFEAEFYWAPSLPEEKRAAFAKLEIDISSFLPAVLLLTLAREQVSCERVAIEGNKAFVAFSHERTMSEAAKLLDPPRSLIQHLVGGSMSHRFLDPSHWLVWTPYPGISDALVEASKILSEKPPRAAFLKALSADWGQLSGILGMLLDCMLEYPKPEIIAPVPRFDCLSSIPMHPTFNPSHDFFTCRPSEYLRKCYDELAVVCRWMVASALHDPNFFFVGKTEENADGLSSITFVCTGPTNPPRMLQYWKDAFQSFTKKKPNSNLKQKILRSIDDFFNFTGSWDCRLLLKSLKHFLKGIDRTEVFLRTVCSMLVHRSYMDPEIRLDLPSNMIGYLKGFFAEVKNLFENINLGDSNLWPFAEQIITHKKQLLRMEQAIPFFERIHLEVGDDERPSIDDFIQHLSTTTRPEEAQSIAVVVGSRFTIPLTLLPSAGTKLLENSLRVQADREPSPELAIGCSISRWNWNNERPELTTFQLGDPLSVSNHDMLTRAFEAFGLVLNWYVTQFWTSFGTISDAIKKNTIGKLKRTVAKTVEGYILPFTQVSQDATASAADDHELRIFDADVLLNIPIPAFQKAVEPIKDIKNARNNMSHQKFVMNPAELTREKVSNWTAAMIKILDLLHQDLQLNPNQLMPEIVQDARLTLKTVSVAVSNHGAYTVFWIRQRNLLSLQLSDIEVLWCKILLEEIKRSPQNAHRDIFRTLSYRWRYRKVKSQWQCLGIDDFFEDDGYEPV